MLHLLCPRIPLVVEVQESTVPVLAEVGVDIVAAVN
jgi:hypothetical protein